MGQKNKINLSVNENSKRRRKVGESPKENLDEELSKQISFKLTPSMHQKFKMYCLLNKTTFKEVLLSHIDDITKNL